MVRITSEVLTRLGCASLDEARVETDFADVWPVEDPAEESFQAQPVAAVWTGAILTLNKGNGEDKIR